MNREYAPKDQDTLEENFYPSGQIKETRYAQNGQPSNGWTARSFYETGMLQREQSFSHGSIIEQVEYDETGRIRSHKIYSHGQKKLIDKPVSKPSPRPNVVSGYGHMGFYYRFLPAIAEFIGADYKEESLDKAYQDFLADANTYELTDEDYEEREYRWSLQGKRMNFALWFEKHEMLFQWHLWAKNEEDYEEARAFMESLRLQ
jgi:hypothetical protein